MGKGTIISGGTNGRYVLQPNYDTILLDQQVDLLTIQITEFGTKVPALQAEVDDWNDNMNQALEQMALLDPNNPDEIDEYREFQQDYLYYLQERDRAQNKVNLAKTHLLSAEKKKAKLVAAKAKVQANQEVWCADFSEELTGEVATVEVPNELYNYPMQIRPGYGGGETYNAARDGMLTPILGLSAAGAFYNLAMLPGKQKWKPQYRYGTITYISQYQASEPHQVASVSFDSQYSSQQVLHINQATSIDNVPAEYMDCDMGAFGVGDQVLVEFTGRDFTQPKIIGFKDNPKKCEWQIIARIGIQFVPGIKDNGQGIYTTNGYYSPSDMTPQVSFLWNCEKNTMVYLDGKAAGPALTTDLETTFQEKTGYGFSTYTASCQNLFWRVKPAPTSNLWPFEKWGDPYPITPCDNVMMRYEGIDPLLPEPTHNKWIELKEIYGAVGGNPAWRHYWPQRWADAQFSGMVDSNWASRYSGLCEEYCIGYRDSFGKCTYPMMPPPYWCGTMSWYDNATRLGTYYSWYPFHAGWMESPTTPYTKWTAMGIQKSCNGGEKGVVYKGGKYSDVYNPGPPAGDDMNENTWYHGTKNYAESWGTLDETNYSADTGYKCNQDEDEGERWFYKWSINSTGGYYLNSTHLNFDFDEDHYSSPLAGQGYRIYDTVSMINSFDMKQGPYLLGRGKGADDAWFPWTNTYSYIPTNYTLGNDETFGIYCAADLSTRYFRIGFTARADATHEHEIQWMATCVKKNEGIRLSAWAWADYDRQSTYRYSLMCDEDPGSVLQCSMTATGLINYEWSIAYINPYDMGQFLDESAYDHQPAWSDGSNTGFTYGGTYYRAPQVVNASTHKAEFFPQSVGYWSDPDVYPQNDTKLQIGVNLVMYGICYSYFYDYTNYTGTGHRPSDYYLQPSQYAVEAICWQPDLPQTRNPFTEGGYSGALSAAVQNLLTYAHGLYGESKTVDLDLCTELYHNNLGLFRYVPILEIKLYKIPKGISIG